MSAVVRYSLSNDWQEMHKQAARLLGKIVVAGQETVQGARKSMREDIYKKHISADKVPERLPYAVDAALVALRGWKRFEMNAYPRLLVKPAFHLCVFLCLSGTLFSFMSFVPSLVPRPWKFVSVTEPAIHFRRTVACRYKATFVEPSPNSWPRRVSSGEGRFCKGPNSQGRLARQSGLCGDAPVCVQLHDTTLPLPAERLWKMMPSREA